MKAHRALSRGRKDPNPPPVEEEEPSDDDEEEVDTRVAGKAHAKSCKVTGVERKASLALPSHDFTIESFDKKGVKRRVGGDSFIVSIRGTNKVRARVTDRQNGTYIVKWKPATSGTYHILVTLDGKQLSGSPWICHIHDNAPYAPRCEVKGRADYRWRYYHSQSVWSR